MSDSSTFKIIFPREEHASAIGEFNARLALETENKTLDSKIVAENDRRLIQSSPENPHLEQIKTSPGFYLLALETGSERPVGCMMITYEMNLEKGGLLYCIQSVYVDKEFRNKGVFKQLFNFGKDLASKDPGCVGL